MRKFDYWEDIIAIWVFPAVFFGVIITGFVVAIIFAYNHSAEETKRLYIERGFVERWNPELQRTEWVKCEMLTPGR